jgi:hypothetical protein
MAKANKKNEVTFIARCKNQALWVGAPDAPEYDAIGRRVGNPGKLVEFEDHRLTTSDPEVIDSIRSTRLFNVSIWQEGEAPNEPKPTIASQLAAITKAVAKQDADGVQAVVEEERATHKRVVVLEAAKNALEALAGDDDSSDEKDESSQPTSTRSVRA